MEVVISHAKETEVIVPEKNKGENIYQVDLVVEVVYSGELPLPIRGHVRLSLRERDADQVVCRSRLDQKTISSSVVVKVA